MGSENQALDFPDFTPTGQALRDQPRGTLGRTPASTYPGGHSIRTSPRSG